jgi:VWFA-related protein
MKRFVILLFVMYSLILTSNGQAQVQTDKEGLSYEVSVDAQLVPIFAVDKDGNPVYDLKPEDFELFADGKPAEIISFNCYSLKTTENTGKIPETQPSVQPPVQPENSPERLNFIIIDSIASNRSIIKPAVEVVQRIINRAPPNDGFVLMESRIDRGIQYIIGPEKDKAKLTEALKDIENNFFGRETDVDQYTALQLQRTASSMAGKGIGNSTEVAMIEYMNAMTKAEIERRLYLNDIRLFSESIRQLKYALKTISLPKTFFLISAGPLKTERRVLNINAYKQLVKAAQSISLGGSLLYIINPLEILTLEEKNAFKFMTDSVSGKFIYGQDFDNIVDQVKKNTSAYYELAFYSHEKPDHVSKVEVKCKREGVSLTSIGFSEKSRPYIRMNTTEKELFALSVVTQGSWSRLVAKIGRIKYNKIKESQSKKDPCIIQLNIPPLMRNQKLDSFIVYLDPKTLEADFEFQQKLMTDTETIEVQPREKRDAYFVIIEPKIPVCIYNQVM